MSHTMDESDPDYWLDDEEIAAKRAKMFADTGLTIVDGLPKSENGDFLPLIWTPIPN